MSDLLFSGRVTADLWDLNAGILTNVLIHELYGALTNTSLGLAARRGDWDSFTTALHVGLCRGTAALLATWRANLGAADLACTLKLVF